MYPSALIRLWKVFMNRSCILFALVSLASGIMQGIQVILINKWIKIRILIPMVVYQKITLLLPCEFIIYSLFNKYLSKVCQTLRLSGKADKGPCPNKLYCFSLILINNTSCCILVFPRYFESVINLWTLWETPEVTDNCLILILLCMYIYPIVTYWQRRSDEGQNRILFLFHKYGIITLEASNTDCSYVMSDI